MNLSSNFEPKMGLASPVKGNIASTKSSIGYCNIRRHRCHKDPGESGAKWMLIVSKLKQLLKITVVHNI